MAEGGSTHDSEKAETSAARAEGRVAKRRRGTRARLLEAAHAVVSEVGVDAAKIKDITDRADVGFGTFYTFFSTKDEVASQVLDCLIDDLGRRNVLATRGLRKRDPALVMPVSMRLVMREAVASPMWQWWALRPDLLVDRMRVGFGPFGKRDMRDAIERGIFLISPDEIDSTWALSIWMMAGGIHDIIAGHRARDGDAFVVDGIVRMMGVEPAVAHRISRVALPAYPAPGIDWTFQRDEAGPAL